MFFFFSHDYIQMEKEEGSFVGAEVSSRSEPPPFRFEPERAAAVTRRSYSGGRNVKGLVHSHGVVLQCKRAVWEVAHSVTLRSRRKAWATSPSGQE